MPTPMIANVMAKLVCAVGSHVTTSHLRLFDLIGPQNLGPRPHLLVILNNKEGNQ